MLKGAIGILVTVVFLIGSLGTAAVAILLIFEEFSPSPDLPPNIAAAELNGIERARRFYAQPLIVTAIMLAINSMAVAILGWNLGQRCGWWVIEILHAIPVWIFILLICSQILAIPRTIDLMNLPDTKEFDIARRTSYPAAVGIILFLPVFIFLAVWRDLCKYSDTGVSCPSMLTRHEPGENRHETEESGSN